MKHKGSVRWEGRLGQAFDMNDESYAHTDGENRLKGGPVCMHVRGEKEGREDNKDGESQAI